MFLSAFVATWFGFLAGVFGFVSILISHSRFCTAIGVCDISIGMFFALIGSLQISIIIYQ